MRSASAYAAPAPWHASQPTSTAIAGPAGASPVAWQPRQRGSGRVANRSRVREFGGMTTAARRAAGPVTAGCAYLAHPRKADERDDRDAKPEHAARGHRGQPYPGFARLW